MYFGLFSVQDDAAGASPSFWTPRLLVFCVEGVLVNIPLHDEISTTRRGKLISCRKLGRIQLKVAKQVGERI